MIGLLMKAAMAIVLFAGSLVGGLAATGRLNHEGAANIPLLGALFPAPPEPEEPEGSTVADTKAADGAGAERGAGGGATPQDAHASPVGETAAADANAPANQGADAPRKRKTGRSLFDDGKGDAAADPHGAADAGAKAEAQPHGERPSAPPAAPAPAAGAAKGERRSGPDADFQQLQTALVNGNSSYRPGEFFRFDGMPAGLGPDQINDAWQRVQGLTTELERRKVALDLQEQQVRELNEDVSRRQAALGKERVEIEQMHRDLDAKIEKFREQVKLVRTDEVAALERNAQTLASFEPSKAAELLEVQWRTEKGQDEVLKLLEFMEERAVNAILDALPKELTNDLLKKRLRVSKETSPPRRGD